MDPHNLISVKFVLILFLFSLPFFKISCNDREITQLSGYDLAFGTTIEYNRGAKHEVPAQRDATFAVIFCVIGLIGSFIRNKYGTITCTLSSGIALMSLLILFFRIVLDQGGNSKGLIKVQLDTEPMLWFWVVLIILLSNLVMPTNKKSSNEL